MTGRRAPALGPTPVLGPKPALAPLSGRRFRCEPRSGPLRGQPAGPSASGARSRSSPRAHGLPTRLPELAARETPRCGRFPRCGTTCSASFARWTGLHLGGRGGERTAAGRMRWVPRRRAVRARVGAPLARDAQPHPPPRSACRRESELDAAATLSLAYERGTGRGERRGRESGGGGGETAEQGRPG